MMQRPRLNGARNEGLSATVSARALAMRAPADGSLDQDGTSPHRCRVMIRPAAPWTTTGTTAVGARLYRAWKPDSASASNWAEMASMGELRAYRPHMAASYPRAAFR